MGEYRFERVSAEHYPDVVFLARESYGVEPSIDDIRRLFDTSSFGADHLAYIAYHVATGQPAAFYGIFPCFVEIDGERILAAQSGSTMTHPDHRRRNLFFLTAKETFKLAASEKIAFVYGMPNASSYRGLMKLGWTHFDDAVRYRMFVPALPLGILGGRSPLLRRLHGWLFRKIISFWRIPGFPLPSSALEPGIGGLHRCTESYNYKPEDDQHLMLEIDGVSVWINHHDGQIGIGDIDLSGPHVNLRKIIRRLRLIAFLSGCSFVRTYLSPDSRLDREFRNAGFKGTKALANCFLTLARGVGPHRFKWMYGDYDTF